MPKLIDTHCHLAAPDFDRDRDEVIARARDAGVVAAVAVGEDYEDNLRVLEVAARSTFIRPALGHHPWRLASARSDVPRTLGLIEKSRHLLVAVGEVGLDYRVAESASERADQRAVFAEFIGVASALNLPLSIHVRSAGHYVLDMLREHNVQRAVLHAFDGKARYAVEGAGSGYFFSIPATVLVSRQKQKLVAALPDSSLLLESDSPALAAERGIRNEPAVITRSIATIADIRESTAQEIAALTTANALKAFDSILPVGDSDS